jgi:hypothetical protein
MSYNSITQIASSPTLLNRVAAAAAEQGQSDPVGWAQRHAWDIAAQEGWADAWDYAESTATINVNPDTGVRDDVINDQMIKDAVYSLMASEAVAPQAQQLNE